MQALTLIDDVQETQIFRPKPKRLMKSKRHIKQIRTSSNSNNVISYHWDSIKNEKELNLDKISLEEIKKDFINLNQISEEELFFNEIMHIIKLSNKTKRKLCISDKLNSKKGKRSIRINEKA